jgi:hypothetical protein
MSMIEIKQEMDRVRGNIAEAEKTISETTDPHVKAIVGLYKAQMVTALTLSDYMIKTEERLTKLEASFHKESIEAKP